MNYNCPSCDNDLNWKLMIPIESVNRVKIYNCPECGARIKENKLKFTWEVGLVFFLVIVQFFMPISVIRIFVIATAVTLGVYLL